MTVIELIKHLQKYPKDIPVYLTPDGSTYKSITESNLNIRVSYNSPWADDDDPSRRESLNIDLSTTFVVDTVNIAIPYK